MREKRGGAWSLAAPFLGHRRLRLKRQRVSRRVLKVDGRFPRKPAFGEPAHNGLVQSLAAREKHTTPSSDCDETSRDGVMIMRLF